MAREHGHTATAAALEKLVLECEMDPEELLTLLVIKVKEARILDDKQEISKLKDQMKSVTHKIMQERKVQALSDQLLEAGLRGQAERILQLAKEHGHTGTDAALEKLQRQHMSGLGADGAELKCARSEEVANICAICLETPTDPISSCKQPQHAFCRACVNAMVERGCPTTHVCPMCVRGSLQKADALWAECCQLHRRAELLQEGDAKTAIYCQQFNLLQHVCQLDHKHALAQNNLANMYESGDGVEKDMQRAVMWCRKAAEQGYAPAQYNLANLANLAAMYLHGIS
jgi:TPR repeat protein